MQTDTYVCVSPLNGYAHAVEDQFERADIMHFAVGVVPPHPDGGPASIKLLNESLITDH